MIDILDVQAGSSYACKFRAKTMVDVLGRPAPNLSDQPLAGEKLYEGFGVLRQRDCEQRLVVVYDEASKRDFIVSFDDIWDIDTVEWSD